MNLVLNKRSIKLRKKVTINSPPKFDLEKNVIKDYKDCISVLKICMKYGISTTRAYKILYSNNIIMFRNKNKNRDKKIFKLYDKGIKMKEIAVELGLTYDVVASAIKRSHPTNRVTKPYQMKEYVKKVKKLYEKGLSKKDIALILDMKDYQVRNIIRRYII